MEKTEKTKGRKFICMVMIYIYSIFVTITCMWKTENLQLVNFHIVVLITLASYFPANIFKEKFKNANINEINNIINKVGK